MFTAENDSDLSLTFFKYNFMMEIYFRDEAHR